MPVTPPAKVVCARSSAFITVCPGSSFSAEVPGSPSAPRQRWTWQSISPGIKVPSDVSTTVPEKPSNSASGATRTTLSSSTITP